MKKRIVSGLIAFLIAFNAVSPFSVSAESTTYADMPYGTCIQFVYRPGENYPYGYVGATISGRVMCVKDGNSYNLVLVMPADNSSAYYFYASTLQQTMSGACPSFGNWRNTSITVNGIKYFYTSVPGYTNNPSEWTIPIVDPGADGLRANEPSTFVYYTYGAGAVDPGPQPPSYGRPANVRYSSRIAGQGKAAGENIDRITWDSVLDTNSNELPEDSKVQIRAIPGKYTGSSQQDVLTKTYTDFVLNQTDAVILGETNATRGFYETKWEEVANAFEMPFATITSILEGETYWYKNGWMYQVRLVIDDYESDWVNVYSATSSGAEVSQNISNAVTFDQTLIQNIEIVNQINGITENWYISETEINMQPYVEPDPGDKPWWAYLLEAITSLVNKVVEGITTIINSIINAVSDLLDGILGLFSFDSFEIPDWQEQQDQIKQDSGIFGQAIDFTNSLHQTFSSVQYADPVLHYDGIKFDDVQIIPALDVNLNDYVTQLGLTDFRNIAYLVTDGSIFLSLVILIIKKLEGVFRR